MKSAFVLFGITMLCAGCSRTRVLPPGIDADFFRVGVDSLHYVIDEPADARDGLQPAFVLVHGSGEQTRHWNQNISRRLTEQGFIALRFDKRGTGYSSGKLPDVNRRNSLETVPLLASDVAAAVDVLRKHPGVDPERIGLVGVSQAGWIVPRAVLISGHVDWMLLYVGPTVSVGEEAEYSRAASKDEDRSVEDLSASLDNFNGTPGYDPASDLEKISIPGLWLFGEQDRSIPTRQSVEQLEELITEVDAPFSYRIYPDVGHCLHTCGADVWPDVEEWIRNLGLVR